MGIAGAGITRGMFSLARGSANSLHVTRMSGNGRCRRALCGVPVRVKPYQVPLVLMRSGAQVPVVACQGWPPGVCHKCKRFALDRFNVKLPD